MKLLRFGEVAIRRSRDFGARLVSLPDQGSGCERKGEKRAISQSQKCCRWKLVSGEGGRHSALREVKLFRLRYRFSKGQVSAAEAAQCRFRARVGFANHRIVWHNRGRRKVLRWQGQSACSQANNRQKTGKGRKH